MCEVMYMYTKVVRSWGGASGLRNNHYVIANYHYPVQCRKINFYLCTCCTC